MNNELIKYLHSGYPELLIDVGYMRGYSVDEIQKIERLYDIEVKDQLYDFLTSIGRCSGGLFGDDPLLFYRNQKTIRGSILMQSGMREDLAAIQQYDLLDKKPFFISVESYTQYFFVLTTSDTPNVVYQYDENEETVQATNWDLKNYLKHVVNVYTRNYDVKASFDQHGELIII
ncbi:hypothetical protein R4U62_000530 [Proteus mirabilis]|uniref:hypothetical protein n=1 Tax=Proteus mirabilis TaxID=584 RepID=UPI0007A6201E|nr:hypothetical protein [Proteus mirabilis]ELA8072579.1 hypothetical protein [Proteus mirabilis]ELJ9400670.1 hypothetical protein [Proteus mirabilis]ELJ9438571.1 hypothetical protein [Proteus mirabilis]ELS1786142.1 hypothetical protein [Proteus mirabilis]ELS1792917.1 hypothetical protein [Proteus mirabilis]